MVPDIRQKYNQRFSQAAYDALMARIEQDCPGQLEFRVAETPVFIDRALKQKLVAAGDYVVSHITAPGFKDRTLEAIPARCQVPGESAHTEFLALDYAICRNPATGELEPKMIELQGFPSLFAWQQYFSATQPEYLYVPPNYSYFFDPAMNGQSYLGLLKRTICGNHVPDDVILLEIEPHMQKTRVDFYCTQKLIGVDTVCLTELQVEGRQVFRTGPDGRRRQVRRIYNRVIFDELLQRTDLQTPFDFAADYDLEWAGHPAWFFRISKYILPMLDHESVPKTYRMTEFTPAEADLPHYVLKPLFSFAGQGVVFDVTPADLVAVPDPENWILMEKVQYAPALQSPVGDIKVEIRMLYLWPEGDARPTLCTNLVRLSQGSMMGVRYNKDKTWVGGNTAYFES